MLGRRRCFLQQVPRTTLPTTFLSTHNDSQSNVLAVADLFVEAVSLVNHQPLACLGLLVPVSVHFQITWA